MLLENKKHIHFIGIGGSGMFPLAQILHGKGYYLTGSDNNETDTLQMVREMGIPVTLGQRAENIEGADLIVHTAAIMDDNPELIAARASGVPTIERSVLLGEISAWYPAAICVSGTHGKTTTSSMTTQILLDAGLDPTCVIGGKLPAIHGGGRIGKSGAMVCEACEFVDTFLKLHPDIAVILNIDADHLDYFKTMENLIASFHKFASMATRAVIANGDDQNTLKALKDLDKRIITFGYSSINDYYPANIEHVDGVTISFDLCRDSEILTPIRLHVPGDHNILNAIAACIAAHEVGASWEQCAKGLDAFHGAQRRFEVLGKFGGITVADDYGHHPTEITATLTAAKKLPFKRVWAVHQPFTYSRTAMLLDDFAKALSIADRVVLSEIMGSREKNTWNIYAKDLAEKIPGCVWFPEFPEIADYVVAHAEPGDLIITLGCGDVNKCAHMMVDLLSKKYGG
ncbi:MAG TPA: UDP-N-acetylmuramate--L-alanine ligase [Candidatus Merdivicinus excrementipullorum]|uniref:UDP-N-acetylmuramate--L-alanine ligase n=1 Tax=Candidatus Merdivicinus excrementipullorum TaxID=2840867 RepID=A0A9D1JZ12_9FIRM|nr:UDP-N-acetylmuramate--L-alanine ligase [Candidatus Merdivicinus excrementipullorum]